MLEHTLRWRFAVLVMSCLAAGVAGSFASAAPAAKDAARAEVKTFKPGELEQLVAPVALYPDSLLAQIFMASTYPLEVVQAERWASANQELKGNALAAELEKKDWDPSIKSLVNFRQVLTLMSTQLDWTTRLGDAFIADQAALMAAVQRLRAKAKAEGNLKDSPEQKVVVEQAPPQTGAVQGATPPPPQVITIESASPTVVYVPTYDPAVIYGAWAYPAYPPPPPYYPVAGRFVSFGAGVAVGFAWGYAWGHCDWNRGNVDVDVNRNANLNRNINRERYRQDIQNRSVSRDGQNQFQHDPAHRKGVSYRDQATADKFKRPGGSDAAKARENFRGRADAGRQDIARGGADQFQGRNVPDRTPGASPIRTDRMREPERAGAGGNFRSDVQRTSQSRGNAFSGADRGGAATRADSSRGYASRSGSLSPGGSMRGGGARGGRR